MPKNTDNQPITYRDAGVDIDAGNALVEAIKPLAKMTRRPGANAELGGFGGVFDLAACGFEDPVLVAANDGVGTKLKIAIEAGIHDTIGIDLVAMSVNDLLVQGAEPLFFLDYFSCGQLNLDIAKSVIAGIAEGCRQAGCALIGGETAEMPGIYSAADYDLAGFALGAVERNRLLPQPTLCAGDILLGLPASGPHSNGYSLIRKIVETQNLDYATKAPFAADKPLAEALLSPTRIYAGALLPTLKQTTGIKAMAHITGGGFTENIPRILPQDVTAAIDLKKLPFTAVFDWLRHAAGLDQGEMLKTFNCGIGMVLFCNEAEADTITTLLQQSGETAVPLGRLEKQITAGEQIRYHGSLGSG